MKKNVYMILALLGMPHLLIAAAMPKPIDSKVQVEHYTEIQRKIAENPLCCVTPQEWVQFTYNHPTIRKKTNCESTVGHFMKLFTQDDTAWETIKKRIGKLRISPQAPIMPHEFFGTYGHIPPTIIKSLFNNPNELEHKLFVFFLAQDFSEKTGHVFIIEKKNTTTFHPTWRIYQSFETFFTAAEWVGAHAWQQPHKDLTTLHKDFGNCKPLNEIEVHNFMQRIPRFISKNPKNLQCYIHMWDNIPTYLAKNVNKEDIKNALACWQATQKEEQQNNKSLQ